MKHRVSANRTERTRSDRGDTLIEVIIAVTIIALVAAPLLGALIETLTSSGEHRSLATLDTLMKGFAETATSEIELNHVAGPTPGATPTAFNNCAGNVDYQLLSVPTPRSAAVGAAVTVFTTGFASAIPTPTFHVKVGGVPATILHTQSQALSGTQMGNMQITFRVPNVPEGSQAISVTGPSPSGLSTTITSTSATNLKVTPNAATSARSPVAGYTLGVKSVRYWTAASGWTTSCVLNSGLQFLTVHGRAKTGVSDTLTFDLRNPTPVSVPVPTPAVTVRPTPRFAALPPPTSSITFTATVTSAAGRPRPTRPVTWAMTEAGHPLTPPCTSSTPGSPGTGNSETYTCTVTLGPTSPTGRYTATATYPAKLPTNNSSSGAGFANVYGANGSGTMAVAPGTAAKGSPGNTFTFTFTAGAGGTYDGEVTLTVPPALSTPTKAWTPPQNANPNIGGYTVVRIGATVLTAHTVACSGNTIQVTSVSLTAGSTLTIFYGQGGGTSGVTAPKTTGAYVFKSQEASVPGGALGSLTSSTVTVS